ncbi:MAG TPA: glycosyltransferase family 4 protein [Candidatus Limnocylindria bacterium]|jgi:glycosyltransferase involved in cell wall biosynthesis|nr:glycosyltransferase family 4 protein [Candidatus Limnocylindria bacterium]
MTKTEMSVGIVVHDFDSGFGQGRYCIEIVRRLCDRIKFTIFSCTYASQEMPNVTWVKVPTLRYDALTTVFTFVPSAERMLKKHPTDLVHCQGLTSWSSDIITGHICNAARLKRMNTRWVKPRLFAQLVTPPERWFYQNPKARHVISISRVLDAEIRREYGWNKPSTVIYHGTDSIQFRPPEPGERARLRERFKIAGDDWTWLFMGEAIKGLRQVIDQLVDFPTAKLLVVTRSSLKMYQEQAERLGVLDRVIFHGFEKRPEEAFRAVDVFLYPSDYDPFGMVVSEAMASGVPVLVGYELGAAELITDHETGLLIDPHQPDSIRNALKWIEADPVRAKAMGVAGRAAIQQHSWDVCAEATLEVYRRVYREKFPA